MAFTLELNSKCQEPASCSMACFTARLVVNGPGVKRSLSCELERVAAILDFRFQIISDFGFRISDFGFRTFRLFRNSASAFAGGLESLEHWFCDPAIGGFQSKDVSQRGGRVVSIH